MTMDRRDFLKLIGLGGVALTLPKPLEVVAARMADLERPPLHVGRVSLTSRPEATFAMYDFTLHLPRTISKHAYSDFMEHWMLRMSAREQDGKTVDYLRVACSFIPMGDAFDPELRGYGGLLAGMTPRRQPYVMGVPLMISPDRVMEFWLMPDGLQRFPMPKAQLCFYGTQIPRVSDRRHLAADRLFINASFEEVRVERDEAIRLGIALADEGPDDLDVVAKKELVIVGGDRE